jgi:short-subunit dehydrogenase
MNKRVLIIGGSSGLGRQLAAVYAGTGASVAVVARRGQLLNELKIELPSIIIRQADIADPSIITIIGELLIELKGLDLLILAASIIHFNPSLDPLAEEETIEVNVKGFTRILDVVWPYLKSAGSGQIAGITSIAAARGNKMAPAYHASKAYQSIYLESLRVRAAFEKNNIAVTEIIPGYMDTAMGIGDRKFWVAPVKKAARQAFNAIEQKRKRVFVTKRWELIYYGQRWMPGFMYDWFVNRKK